MQYKSYLVSLEGTNHKAADLLNMAIGNRGVECVWSSDLGIKMGGTDSNIIVVPEDADGESLLDELKQAGWSVQLAPAGVYSGKSHNTDDCTIPFDGAEPVRQPRSR